MKTREKQWEGLSERIFSEMKETLGNEAEAREYTDKMIAELQDFYKIYDSEKLVRWFAGLYEPNIRFSLNATEEQKERYSGGAGFYFSNSARDNYKVIRDGKEYQLLPDAETTAQAFGFLKNSGMLDSVGRDVKAAFPEEEQKKMIRFIKALQDPESGNLYHPQWLSMLGTEDFWDSRRARDLNYGTNVLLALGSAPTYDTPAGVKGDGILYDGTKVEISSPDAPEEAKAQPSVKKVHPRLESLQTFEEYLNTLNLPGNSYFVGNELASLAGEIVERDKQVGTAENPRPYATMLDKWIRSYQNPETGVWHDNEKNPVASVYYPNNGVLKIAAMYNTLGMPFPNPLAAAKSAFAIITSEQPIGHVCDLYNTWFTVDMIAYNLKKYAGDDALANKIIADVRLAAIPAVKATKEKMQENLIEDGSFRYHRIHPRQSCTPENPGGYGVSQNAPVCLRNNVEGDVNATVIFTYGILGFMFGALNFGEIVPICDESDRILFRKLIEEKSKSN